MELEGLESYDELGVEEFEGAEELGAFREFEGSDEFSEEELGDLALRGVRRVADELEAEFDAIDEEAEDEAPEDDLGYEYEEYEDYGDYDDEDEEWEDKEIDDGPERTKELEREQQFEVLTVSKEMLSEYELPDDLPTGVAVMGGVARSIARRLLTGEVEPVRDLDLVYVPELVEDGGELSEEDLDWLSKEYMPDDYIYGHGVETANLEEYFATRDFTMNQCLIVGNRLLMTKAAQEDLTANVIRPSYDTQPNEETPISERLFLKALMMKATFEVAFDREVELEDFGMRKIWNKIDRGEYIDTKLGAFNIALMLRKAMSRGEETAKHFAEILAEYEVVDEDFSGKPKDIARLVKFWCPKFNFQMSGDDWLERDWEEEEPEDEVDGLYEWGFEEEK